MVGFLVLWCCFFVYVGVCLFSFCRNCEKHTLDITKINSLEQS